LNRFDDPDGRVPVLLAIPAAIASPPGQAAVAATYVAGATAFAVSGYYANKIAGHIQRDLFGELTQNNEKSDDDGPTDGTTTVEDLIGQATPGRKTKGRTRLHELPGGIDEANNDFDDLNPNKVEPIDTPFGEGRRGTLPGVGTVIVRPGSSGENSRPTLEVQ